MRFTHDGILRDMVAAITGSLRPGYRQQGWNVLLSRTHGRHRACTVDRAQPRVQRIRLSTVTGAPARSSQRSPVMQKS